MKINSRSAAWTLSSGMVALAFFSNHLAWAFEGSGLQISAAADIYARGGVDGTRKQRGRAEVRDAELMLCAPTDYLFDGTVVAAAHQEEGVSLFEVHEAHLSSSKLIPRSRMRLGLFFLGIGRLNQFHRHDWPFISAPRVHQEFFGQEGISDTGFEYTYLIPTPFFWELTGGIANGWTFGHTHNEGRAPRTPTHYLRTVFGVPMPADGDSQLGFSFLGRQANDQVWSRFAGADFTAKWREGRVLRWLVQTEFWHRWQGKVGAFERHAGYYLYPQYGFNENWSAGVRLDYYTHLNLTDINGRGISSVQWAFAPTVIWAPSEFTKLRLAFTQERVARGGTQIGNYNQVEFSTVFFLGAHPAHEF